MPRWPPTLWVGRSEGRPKFVQTAIFGALVFFLCRLHLHASQNTSTANDGRSTDQGETTKMTTLMEQEKQRISERLARLDAEREKLSGQLDELEIAERVLARFGGRAVTTEKRQRARPARTTPAPAGKRGSRSSKKAPGVSISEASFEGRTGAWRGRHARRTPQLSLTGIRDDGPAQSPWCRAATSPPCRPA